jgi:hypothetical protein
MSLSQIFYDMRSVDASANWEIVKRLEEIEKKKGEDGNMKNVPTVAYDIDDEGFKALVRTIALSTTSFFAYTASNDEIRAKIAKDGKINISSVPKDFAEGQPMWAEYCDTKKKMIEIEESKPYTKRCVQGDASETGLIKFCQPLLMGDKYGCYNEKGLNGVRDQFPYARGVDDVDAIIPFSSDIKFNLQVRDMCKENQSPSTAEENAWIFIKGAPERVLGRCKTILV